MAPWNPTARREPVTLDVPSSEGEATITVLPWSARERLAYQDASMAAMQLVSVDGADGEETSIRRIKMSAMTLEYITRTIVGCAGFGTGPDGKPFAFDDVDHVLSLDPDVLDEVVELAQTVQPVPGSEVKKPQDRKPPAAATEETAADFDEGDDDEDPSPTPSRPATRRRP